MKQPKLTLAQKICAAHEMRNKDGLIEVAVAESFGFDVSHIYTAQDSGVVFPESLAFSVLAEAKFDGENSIIPNIVDVLGRHYKLKDGSWIMFQHTGGWAPLPSSGSVYDGPVWD